MRQIFHPRTKKSPLSKAIRAAFFAAGVGGVVVVVKALIENMVERRVKKRLEGMELGFGKGAV